MGLFSNTKKVSVNSMLYNLAGAVETRPDFIKSIVVQKTLVGSNSTFTDALQRGLIRGPGMNLRSYFRWAQGQYHYDRVGVPEGRIGGTIDLTPAAVAPYIPHDPDQTVRIQALDLALADFAWWAEQWILANQRELLSQDYTTDRDSTTGEILILVDGVEMVRFMPANFDGSKLYIYAAYNLSSGVESGEVMSGPTIILAEGTEFPSVSGWTAVHRTDRPRDIALKTTTTKTTTYGTNPVPTVNTTSSYRVERYSSFDALYQKREYRGQDPDAVDSLWQKVYSLYMSRVHEIVPVYTETTETVTLGDGSTRTTVTGITREELRMVRSHRTDTQDTIIQSWGPLQVFIYELFSGQSGLDALVRAELDGGEYYPFIPCRVDNESMDELDGFTYLQAEKAYKKLTGGQRFSDLLKQINDNEDIDKIDHAYVAHGVPLNVRHNAGKRYLYQYFHRLMVARTEDREGLLLWLAKAAAYNDQMAAWVEWRLAQNDPSNPYYGALAPIPTAYPPKPSNEVRISANGVFDTGFDMRMSWSSISETKGTGILDPAHRVGDVWWSDGILPDQSFEMDLISGLETNTSTVNFSDRRLCWQKSETEWCALSITDLVHRNYIYEGHYVETTMADAIADAEESSFLVPLHYPTFRSISLVDATRIGTDCTFLVFNCYEVQVIKWWQKGWFAVLLIVVVIVVAVATGGIGAAGVGVLGTNIAIGTALGLSGMIAIMVGAIANALAAMILTAIVQKMATAVLGDKLGAIIGAIIAVVSVTAATSLMNGGTLSSMWGSMTSASGLISMTDAVGRGVSQIMNQSTMGILAQTQDMMEDFNKKSAEVAKSYAANLGYDTGLFDPMGLTEVGSILVESPDSFLSRTLMSGSDIADATLRMLSDFSALTLSTDLPIR